MPGSEQQNTGDNLARNASRTVADAEIARLIAEHGDEFMRVARRYSASSADAEDAFQRALEKLVTKTPPAETPLVPWLKTVTRNEALMIRRKYGRLIAMPSEDIDSVTESSRSVPEESSLERDEIARGREALRRIKFDQARCLLLRADGLRYDEIADLTGFSRAKVQDLLWRGRTAIRSHLELVESGAECRRIDPLLSAYADEEIDAVQRVDIQLHLDHCRACQSTLREYRSAPRDLAALFPLGLAIARVRDLWHMPTGVWDALQRWVTDRVVALGGAPGGWEGAFVKKTAAIAALAASALAGGYEVGRLSDGDGERAARSTAAVRAIQPAAGHEDRRIRPATDEKRDVRRRDHTGRSASADELLEAPPDARPNVADANDESPIQNGQAESVLGDGGQPDDSLAGEPIGDSNATELP